jgi:hypothetical protein
MNGRGWFTRPGDVTPRRSASRLRVLLAGLALMVVLWSLSTAIPSSAPPTASAQALLQCPNGQSVPPSQGCYGGSQGYTCPGISVSLPAGGICPTVCANQQIVAAGQPCPQGTYGTQQFTCPGTTLTLPIGTPCPQGYNGAPQFTCPGTAITLPVGTPCPQGSNTTPQFTCPGTSLTLPVGVPCPGNCPAGQLAYSNQPCASGSTAPTPPPAPPSPSLLVPAHSPYATSASYAAGWNIVAAPGSSILSSFSGWLYTFQGGDTSYELIPVGTALKPGAGYWAYAPSPMTSTLAPAAQTSVAVQVPAHQYVMIGNPGNTVATVSGADVVLIYNPSSGSYIPTTQLAAGQGGWAGSANGALVTITNAPA